MQSHSINHTREALTRLREQEELEHRDLKICYTVCLFSTLVFWVWVRSHYISKSELQFATPTDAGEAPFTTRSGGIPYIDWFSKKLSGNSRETAWEKEKRLEREQLHKQQTGDDISQTSSNALNAEEVLRETIRKERAWR
eukprot:GILJ01029525.1.p1 GENE.GILJ01029525.1~~GILJ01029525.1.p1  ORF type:complete len:140 (+),score=16.00 GILJ01029525.1:151-570(+)